MFPGKHKIYRVGDWDDRRCFGLGSIGYFGIGRIEPCSKACYEKKKETFNGVKFGYGKTTWCVGWSAAGDRVAAWCTGIGANHRVNNFDTWQWLGVVCVHLVSDRYLSDAQKNFPLAVLP